jgi:muconolactone delta-isomerase
MYRPLTSLREFVELSGGLDSGRKLSKLCETEIAGFNEKTAHIFLAKAKELAESREFASDDIIKNIRASSGNISKVKDYDKVSQSAKLLASMADRSFVSTEITEVNELMEFMESRTPYFTEGFKNGSFTVSNLYVTLVITVYHSVAELIFNQVQMLKMPTGEYQMNLRKLSKEDTDNKVILQHMKVTIANIRNGRMDRFLKDQHKNTSEYTALKEAFPIVFGAFFVIYVIIHIRDVIYNFLMFRKRIADWFYSYALFIEMHAELIRKDRKDVAKKQEAVAKKFRAMGDIFAVENDLANRNTVAQTRKQDIEVSGEVQNAHSDTAGGILI